jgi:hypothetical protein
MLLTHSESNANDTFTSIPLHPHFHYFLSVLDIYYTDGSIQMTDSDDVDGRGLSKSGDWRWRGDVQSREYVDR